ncbi:MAG: hypothetical protein JNK47_16785 [Mesorhizobium sp.]|nr:hypothetical protein [Mesorhizobium sp.]MBL8578881.1 hypothetical protein [Mesorhizobium sp.]
MDVFAEHLGLPRSFVRQVVNALKVAERIASARPVAPEVTPRAIARIALALTAPSIRKAVETERVLGSLGYVAGQGEINPEDEITDLIESSVGWRTRYDFNLRDGAIIVAHEDLVVTVGDSTFGAKGQKAVKAGGLSRFSRIKFSALAAIARELLPNDRGVA